MSNEAAAEAKPTITFIYRNWRDEIRQRSVTPIRVWFGHTEWHPIAQWFLEATDSETGEKRDFALADILSFEPERHKRDRQLSAIVLESIR